MILEMQLRRRSRIPIDTWYTTTREKSLSDSFKCLFLLRACVLFENARSLLEKKKNASRRTDCSPRALCCFCSDGIYLRVERMMIKEIGFEFWRHFPRETRWKLHNIQTSKDAFRRTILPPLRYLWVLFSNGWLTLDVSKATQTFLQSALPREDFIKRSRTKAK